MLKNYLLTIFYAVIWLTIGTICLLSLNAKWNLLGYVLYVIGIVLVLLSSWFSMWDKFIEKTQAMQYLFDSAKHLDHERLDALLHALGLGSMPVQEYKTNLSINTTDHNDVITNTRNVFNIPASPDQLRTLANGLINEGAPFSRREWVDRRHTLTDQQYRNLQTVFETEKFIQLKSTDNPNAGFKLSDYGVQVLREYAPSPTPHLEEVQNPA